MDFRLLCLVLYLPYYIQASNVYSSSVFNVESAVLSGDVARRDRELGQAVYTKLHVTPTWRKDQEVLLRFQLESPSLHIRGAHDTATWLKVPSLWDEYPSTPFFAHLNDGLISDVYVHADKALDFVNYEKSIMSLFQFVKADTVRNETDLSGSCEVSYEILYTGNFRKVKQNCANTIHESLTKTRSVTHYETVDGTVSDVSCHEEHDVGHQGLTLRTRAWHHLKMLSVSDERPQFDELEKALPTTVTKTSLEIQLNFTQSTPDLATLSSLIEAASDELRGWGEAGGGGRRADLLLPLLVAFREADSKVLVELLRRKHDTELLVGLYGVLGACGSSKTHAAARSTLQLLGSGVSAAVALPYLDSLAHGYVDEKVLLDLLTISTDAKDKSIKKAALRAGAAAIGLSGHSNVNAKLAYEKHIISGLLRCKENPCFERYSKAAGAARCVTCVDDLLAVVSKVSSTGAKLAALQALSTLEARTFTYRRFVKLQNIILGLDAPHSIEVRGKALEVWLEAAAEQSTQSGTLTLPIHLDFVAETLAERGPEELRRLFWQLLADLGDRHPAAKGHAGLVKTWNPRLHHYYVPGSSVTVSRPLWPSLPSAGPWSVSARAVTVSRRSQLRHSTVSLFARHDKFNDIVPLSAITMRAEGMHHFSAAPDTVETPLEDLELNTLEEPEEASAYLSWWWGGSQRGGAKLFSGQAELTGAVFRGDGSNPTPVMAALVPLARIERTVASCIGTTITLKYTSIASVAVDASAQISLWYSNGAAAAVVRGAGAASSSALMRSSAWSPLEASAAAQGHSRLLISAHLDFSSKPDLCVRAYTEDLEYSRNVTLSATWGDHKRAFATSGAVGEAPGRTLALGAENDRVCARMRLSDAN